MDSATRLIALALPIVLAALPVAAARGQTIGADLLADFGLVAPSEQRSFAKGGLGKLEFDGGSPRATGQQLADLRVQADSSLGGFATLRLAPDQHAPFDVLEAYARYQPVSTKSWLWSIKGGAFYPPISLENEGVGWTSPWTLTSSAVNSWVGAELRTIGGEALVEWRHATGSFAATGAVFAANDPTGALLADRGWTFDSRPAGLFAEPRRPDALARLIGLPTPSREEPYKEIDGRPGWYAGLSLRQDGLGRLTALYYDNRADPGAFIGSDFGWRTKFTALGAEVDIGDVVILSQGMFGNTTIEPFDEFYSRTDFQSAYVLAGYSIGDFRVAGRIDVFATQQFNTGGGRGLGEHGHALTFAGSWAPLPWLRLTAEMIRIDSDRGQRALAGTPTRAAELQGQLVGRIVF